MKEREDVAGVMGVTPAQSCRRTYSMDVREGGNCSEKHVCHISIYGRDD